MTTEAFCRNNYLNNFKRFVKKHAFPISLYAVAFTIPFPTLLNNLAIIAFSLVWLFRIRKDWNFLKNALLLLSAFIPFYIWYALGISYSENTISAIKLVLERGATFLVFPLILFTSKQENFSLKRVLLSFTVGFLIILSISIGEILVNINLAGEPLSFLISHYTRWKFTENSSLSYHTPYMGIHAVFCYAVVLSYTKADSLILILLKTALIILLVLGIYLFGSKLPFILLLIVSIFIIAHYYLSDKLSFSAINLFVGGMLIFSTCLIYINRGQLIQAIEKSTGSENLYWGSLPNRFVKFLKSGDQDRIDNWGAAYCAFLKQPLLGSGAGDGLESLQSCRVKSSWNYINEVNAHNQFLDIAVRSGLIGFVLLLGGLVTCFKLSFLFKNKLYLLFLISFTIGLVFENFLDRQKGIVFFTLINSLFLSYHLIHDRYNKGKGKLGQEQLN